MAGIPAEGATPPHRDQHHECQRSSRSLEVSHRRCLRWHCLSAEEHLRGNTNPLQRNALPEYSIQSSHRARSRRPARSAGPTTEDRSHHQIQRSIRVPRCVCMVRSLRAADRCVRAPDFSSDDRCAPDRTRCPTGKPCTGLRRRRDDRSHSRRWPVAKGSTASLRRPQS